MKILLLGSGGREHALAWKLAQSPRVQEILIAPGNAGTARESKCRNIDVAASDFEALLLIAKSENIDLTVVGPEAPLVLGVVDHFQAANLPIFGPSRAAAQLEGSKAYAKEFLQRHHIPSAQYAIFTELDSALNYVRKQTLPIVIKADGLAAGKGVVVAASLPEAEAALRDMLENSSLGDAGLRVVIEEFLHGEEASFICLVDGLHALPMASSQDHKRVGEADTGPNTGGMGAYSPAPVVSKEVHDRVMREVIAPTIKGMHADGNPFIGFLYAGLMIDAAGAPKVIEFNVRFGDPEAQPILMRLQSDLLELIEAAMAQKLDQTNANWDPRIALGVVLAAQNYPATPQLGNRIDGLEFEALANALEPVKIFHAGTKLDAQGQIVSAGGRILCVTTLASDMQNAQQQVYCRLKKIQCEGAFHRNDIGWRALPPSTRKN